MNIELVYNEKDEAGKYIKQKLDNANIKYELIRSEEHQSNLYYLDEVVGIYYIDAFISRVQSGLLRS